MKVLHLNTHASGGSYEYAVLLSSALAQQGIESPVLCKNSTSAKTGRLLLDRLGCYLRPQSRIWKESM